MDNKVGETIKKEAESTTEAKEVALVSRKVTIAIKELQGSKGVNLRDLKKFLKNEKKMDVKESSAHIQLVLKRKMDKGELNKLDGGLYKLTDHKTEAKKTAKKVAKGPAGDGQRVAAKAKKPIGEAKRAVQTPAKKARKPAKIPTTRSEKQVKPPKIAKAEVQEAAAGQHEVAPEVMVL